MKNILFIILLLMVINGCGMMGNSSKSSSSSLALSSLDTNSTQDNNNSSKDGTLHIAKDILPKNISMEFPTILKENNSSQKKGTNDNNSSIGYSQLKRYITEIDNIIKKAEINLIIFKKAMPQVLDRCDGMSSCTFEAGYLSIVLDNKTISDINKITDDTNTTAINKNLNKKIYLGELNFQKYYVVEEDGYKYELKLDLTSNDKILNQIYEKKNSKNIKSKDIIDVNKTKIEYQVFKWSDITDDVTTIYFYKDENESIDVKIYYSVDEHDKESMHILKSNYIINIKNNMNLTLSDGEDSIKLIANSIEEKVLDNNKKVINSFSSNGEITEDNSLILFSGNIEDINNSENNPIISEVLCNSNDCIENNISVNSIKSNKSIESLRENLKFYQIEISDINISDGSYLILPPYTEIGDLKLIDIFKLSIGTFTILDGKAQGEIHSSEYNTQLDELTIIKIEDGEDGQEPLFKVMENIPKIEIIDPLEIDESAKDLGSKFYLQPQYLEYLEQFL